MPPRPRTRSIYGGRLGLATRITGRLTRAERERMIRDARAAFRSHEK